jgi:hypothetical protein
MPSRWAISRTVSPWLRLSKFTIESRWLRPIWEMRRCMKRTGYVSRRSLQIFRGFPSKNLRKMRSDKRKEPRIISRSASTILTSVPAAPARESRRKPLAEKWVVLFRELLADCLGTRALPQDHRGTRRYYRPSIAKNSPTSERRSLKA